MVITEEMRNMVEGRSVAFTYKGINYVRPVYELCDIILGTWVGDLGYEDNDDTNTDSFIIHGNTDEIGCPQMSGLVVQYDSQNGERHGYIRNVRVLK